MKLLNFDVNRQHVRWDRYRAFHLGYDGTPTATNHYYMVPPFIQFDTGELVCALHSPNPGQRRHYSDLNLEVRATADADCPSLTLPDGTKLAKTWLDDGGQQHLLIDHDSNRVVRLDKPMGEGRMPLRFYRSDYSGCGLPLFSAYFAGEGAPPVGGPVAVNRPYQKVLSPEQVEHVQTIALTAKAGMTLTDDPVKDSIYATGPCPVEAILKVATYIELSDQHRAMLFRNGVAKVRTEYEYLLIA